MRNVKYDEILLKYLCVILFNNLLSSLRISHNAFFLKHLLFAVKILIYLIFYVINRVNVFLAKGMFEKKKQIIVGRGYVKRVGRVGKNVPVECKEFVSRSQKYVWPGVLMVEENTSSVG